jgi:hypothetical protein
MSPEAFQTMVTGLAVFYAPILKIWIVIFLGLSVLLGLVLFFLLMLRKGLSAYL